MPTSSPPTKNCPQCGQPMGANRGVCPNLDCDYQSTWFTVRLYFGCAGVLVGFILIAIMLLMTLTAPE